MEIQRVIGIYNNRTELLEGEIEIDHLISLEELKKIFLPPDEDNLMYNSYPLTRDIVPKIYNYFNLEYDFEKYSYYVECFQI